MSKELQWYGRKYQGAMKLAIIIYLMKNESCKMHEFIKESRFYHSDISRKIDQHIRNPEVSLNFKRRSIQNHFKELGNEKLIIFDNKDEKYKLPNNWKTYKYVKHLFEFVRPKKQILKPFYYKLNYYSDEDKMKILKLISNLDKQKNVSNRKGDSIKASELSYVILNEITDLKLAIYLSKYQNNINIKDFKDSLIESIEKGITLIRESKDISDNQRRFLSKNITYAKKKMKKFENDLIIIKKHRNALNNPNTNTIL